MESNWTPAPDARVSGFRPVSSRCPKRAIAWPGWASLWLLSGLALAVLEGAVRKWGLGGAHGLGSYAVYFSKDLMFAALVCLPASRGASRATRQFGSWLGWGAGLVITGAALSSLVTVNPVGALLTLRSAIVLPLLAWWAASRVSRAALRRVLWSLVAFAILNCSLGMVQNKLPPGHPLNRYAAESLEIVAEGSGVRATGTFAYITGLGVMGSVGIWTGLALLSIGRKRWEQIAGLAGIAAGFGCGLASISRGPVLTGAGMVVGWIFLGRPRGRVLLGLITALLLAAGTGVVIGAWPAVEGLWQGVEERQEHATDTLRERIFGHASEVISALRQAPLGRGFGTEQMGGSFYATGEMNFKEYEGQFPRMVMETGAAGLAGFVLVCAGALIALDRARRAAGAVKGRGERRSGRRGKVAIGSEGDWGGVLAATEFLLLSLFCGNVLYNHTASAFAWMIFAAVLGASTSQERESPSMFFPAL
ncbi:MAG TPA: hypothetical protein VG146_17525 [Verrucomicrobiae bacterium]|nr:hypothetical protein [Verrucomicrobiae bacterium]